MNFFRFKTDRSTQTSQSNIVKGLHILTLLVFILLVLTLILLSFEQAELHVLPTYVFCSALLCLSVSILFTLLSFKQFSMGFLVSVFGFLITWRITELYDVTSADVSLCLAFILQLANFLYCIWRSCDGIKSAAQKNKCLLWQLTFIRIYIGLDFIPHFTEKLLAGPQYYIADVTAFKSFGIPYPEFFVLLAGFCELGAAITLAFGFLLRLGAICTTLYLLIATYLGNHFLMGFIWVNHGGGWEFAVMWAMITFSFVLTSTQTFSLDQWITSRFKVPQLLKALM